MRNIFRFVVRIIPPLGHVALAILHWPHDPPTAAVYGLVAVAHLIDRLSER